MIHGTLTPAARAALGTSIVAVLGLTVATVGWDEKRLVAAGRAHRAIHTHPLSHAGYFPGAAPMAIKLLVDPDDDSILGAQIVGTDGVDKRIDVIATAMSAGVHLLPAGPLVVHCQVGQRGHTAARLLTQLGHDARNLDGRLQRARPSRFRHHLYGRWSTCAQGRRAVEPVVPLCMSRNCHEPSPVAYLGRVTGGVLRLGGRARRPRWRSSWVRPPR